MRKLSAYRIIALAVVDFLMLMSPIGIAAQDEGSDTAAQSTPEATEEAGNGETFQDSGTPDTTSDLVLGLVVIFGLLALFSVSLVMRFRSVGNEKARLEDLLEE